MNETADYTLTAELSDGANLADVTATLTEASPEYTNPNWNDDALYNFVNTNAEIPVNVDGQVMTLSAAMNCHPGPWTAENEPSLLAYAQNLVANRVTEIEEPEEKELTEEEVPEEIEKVDLNNKAIEDNVPKQIVSAVEQSGDLTSQVNQKPLAVEQNNADNQVIATQEPLLLNNEMIYQLDLKTMTAETVTPPGIQKEKLTTAPRAIERHAEVAFKNPSIAKSSNSIERIAIEMVSSELDLRNETETPNEQGEAIIGDETAVFEIPDIVADFDIVGENIANYEAVLSLDEEEPDESPAYAEFIEGEVVIITHGQEFGFEDLIMNEGQEKGAPILLLEQYDTDETFTEAERIEINETFAQLVEAIGISEPETFDSVQETIVEILEIALGFEEDRDEAFEEQAVEKLEELFIELFESLEIEYTEEMPKTFARLVIQGQLTHYFKKIVDQDFDKLRQRTGTHEAIQQVLVGSDSSHNFVAQVYALGRSALQLADLALAA